VVILTSVIIGLLIGAVLRVRSDLLSEGLALPLFVVGAFLILSSQTPFGVAIALLVAAYTVVLRGTRVHR
jgi:chromate transport protein ChrA